VKRTFKSVRSLGNTDNWMAECYAQLLLNNVLIFLLSIIISDTSNYYILVIVPAILGFVNCCVIMTKNHAPLANPVMIYAAIWLVGIPLTSIEAPLMEAMTPFEWKMCAAFGVTYCLAGLMLAKRRGMSVEEKTAVDNKLAPSAENALLLLIGISVVAMVVNFSIKGVALFSTDEMLRKTESAFTGYALLSSVGSAGVVLLANCYKLRKSKLYVILLISYLILQALTGARFVATITIIMLLVVIASHRLDRKRLRLIVLGGVGMLLLFAFVSLYRNNSNHMETYYISSGIYSGNASDLTSTEIIRYFGMNQRNMATVLARDFNVKDALEYTLTPITSIFIDQPDSLGTSIYGYTANNIISYAYHDAGWAMWILLFLWSCFVNLAFIRFMQCRESLIRAYWWSAMAMSLSMSFFSYVNAYAYWMLPIPFVVCFIQFISKPMNSFIYAGRQTGKCQEAL
jgi:hypothetical protein